jgi:hypothetical protein
VQIFTPINTIPEHIDYISSDHCTPSINMAYQK